MKKIAVGNMGEEELARLVQIRLTRDDTRAEADLLFGGPAKDMRKADRGLLEKLFVQTPASVTMAPNLQKSASASPLTFMKLAMGLACGPDGSDNWLTQFEGTSLMPQAIALEEQQLQMEQEDIQSRIEEQHRYSQQDQERNAKYQKGDQIRLQKRVLALELAKQKSGMGAPEEGEMPPEAEEMPPEAMEQAAPPQAEPPVKTASVHEKIARVFGADAPGFSTESDIPYAVRKKQYEGYAKAKSKEAPTPYKKSIPTGAGIGGVAGGVLGAILTRNLKGTAIGGAGGAALGGLFGAGATAADKGAIANAKKAIRSSGDMDEALGSHIHKVRRAEAAAKLMHDVSSEMSKERRHRERMDKGPDEVHHTHTHKTEPKRASGKCQNCGAPASGGSLCSHCGSNDFSKQSSITPRVDAFFEKLSAPTDAQRRYPELMKVSEVGTRKVPNIKPRVTTDTSGPTPTKSDLSGGSA